jgi:hypothetical protein
MPATARPKPSQPNRIVLESVNDRVLDAQQILSQEDSEGAQLAGQARQMHGIGNMGPRQDALPSRTLCLDPATNSVLTFGNGFPGRSIGARALRPAVIA